MKARELVINSLRMRPDRIVVGEVRGAEALDMLQAMNTGHDGSLTTIHANTPRDALYRLDTMVAMTNLNIPDRAIRQQVASAVDLIVQVSRQADGTRKVTAISEITGMEQEVITMQDIFLFEKTGFAASGKVSGRFRATGIRPKCNDRLAAVGPSAADGHVRARPDGGVAEWRDDPDSGSRHVSAGASASSGRAYYLLVLKPEEDEQRALRKRLKTGTSRAMTADAAGLLRTEAPFSQIPVVNAILGATGVVSRPAQRLIDRSGLNLTVGALILMCLCAGVAVFLVVQTLSRLTLAAAVVGRRCRVHPDLVRRASRRRSRVGKFEEQFPEAIDLLARALRAGHAFTTGLSMVAEEMPDPVGTEFRLAYDRQNFGMPMPDALKALGERVPLLDARFFVTAVLTQRESGGNLSEVLDNLASVIRERFKVKRQVRVITAHARITGWVLALLPPSLGAVLTCWRRRT